MTHAETSGAENRLRKIDEELARRHQTSRGNMKLLDDLKIKLLLKLHDPNYEEEIDYWRRYLAKDRLALFDASIKRKAFPAFLKHEVNEFREQHGRAPRLLEVGSGPYRCSSTVWRRARSMFLRSTRWVTSTRSF